MSARRVLSAIVLVTALATLPAAPLAAEPVPEGVPALTGARQVAAGERHTCAIVSGGHVLCWGNNDAGNLGQGSYDQYLGRVEVRNATNTGPLTGVTQISVGDFSTCALLANTQVRCWGEDDHLQLGAGTPQEGFLPVAVRNAAGTANLTGATQVMVAPGDFACVILTDRTVRCWGRNDAGQLGDNTLVDRVRPTPVRAVTGSGVLNDVVELAGGLEHACARLTTGQVRCWGENGDGAVGDDTGIDRRRPVRVKAPDGNGLLTGVAEIGVGWAHSCAVLQTGQALCWGADNGALGNAAPNVDRFRPAFVRAVSGFEPLNLVDVAEVDGGKEISCWLMQNEQLRCSGNGTSGELGNGKNQTYYRPVIVSNIPGTGPLTGVDDVSTGAFHACALLLNTQVRCWGENEDGQLGTNDVDPRNRPAIVRSEGPG